MSSLPEPPFRAALLTPAHLGDCVMSTALLAPLAGLSGQGVEVWCRPGHEPLFGGHPAVVAVRAVEPKGRHRGPVGLLRARRDLGGAARALDALWIVPDSLSTALLAAASGVRRRVGFGGQGRGALLTRNLGPPPGRERHWIDGRAGLLADGATSASGLQPAVHPTADATARARDRLQREDVPLDGFAVFVPGAVFGPAKRWTQFAELARVIPQELWVLVLGSAEEAALCRALTESLRAQGRRALALAGALDLGELSALLREARFVVSNDTGPMHLAAAVGGRVLGLFLSTSTQWTAPRGPSVRWLAADVPCRPCFNRVCPLPAMHCDTAVTPWDVRGALADWFEPRRASA